MTETASGRFFYGGSMPVLISGILRDGAGNPVQDCTIQLSAKKTSPTVVVEVTSSTLTGADGHYSIEAEPGYYSVSLLREGFPPSVAGDIYVAPNDTPDTLNAFLDAPKDADLRPEVMKRFEEMVNRVVDLSGATEKDRERAEQAAQSAAQSNDNAAASENAARESALTATQAAEQGDNSAAAAALSEQYAISSYTLPGTWRACGVVSSSSDGLVSGNFEYYAGLFQRIS